MTTTQLSSFLTIKPIFILSHPQMGENIGATARAMLNCGLSELRLVNPRDGWPNDKAIAMSSGAMDKMQPIQVFPDLSSALADCQRAFATTGLTRDIVKPVHTPEDAIEKSYHFTQQGEKIAIVFGCERAGLNNEEMSLCQHLVTIPSNPDFPSLNLAQAVMVMAYEWLKVSNHHPPSTLPTGKSEVASISNFNRFFDRLDNELSETGFYRVPEMKDIISRNIRALFARATPTEQELNTLHGVITSLRSNIKKPLD
jgi:tRNA/rRNA methyltransferase